MKKQFLVLLMTTMGSSVMSPSFAMENSEVPSTVPVKKRFVLYADMQLTCQGGRNCIVSLNNKRRPFAFNADQGILGFEIKDAVNEGKILHFPIDWVIQQLGSNEFKDAKDIGDVWLPVLKYPDLKNLYVKTYYQAIAYVNTSSEPFYEDEDNVYYDGGYSAIRSGPSMNNFMVLNWNEESNTSWQKNISTYEKAVEEKASQLKDWMQEVLKGRSVK